MKYLYLHGLGQNANSWNKVTGITNMLDNTMCLDFPEMLRDKPVTYSNLYMAFSEICDAESEDIILCGLSLGGVLALNYAIDHPQKVKALILIAAQYKMPARLLKVQNLMFHQDPQFKEVSETGHEVNLESPEKLALLLRDFYKSMG